MDHVWTKPQRCYDQSMGRLENYVVAIFFGALSVVGTVLAVLHPHDGPYWHLTLYVAVGSAVASLAALLTMWLKLGGWFRQQWAAAKLLRFRWPVTSEPAAFAPQRLFHSRCLADFSHLQVEHYFTVTLVFFNGTSAPVAIESVSGFLTYDDLAPNQAIPVTWAGGVDAAQPFKWGAVDLRQQMPAAAASRLSQRFQNEQQFVVYLADIRVRLRSLKTNETITLKLWAGFNCGWPALPTPTGETVGLAIVASANAAASLA